MRPFANARRRSFKPGSRKGTGLIQLYVVIGIDGALTWADHSRCAFSAGAPSSMANHVIACAQGTPSRSSTCKRCRQEPRKVTAGNVSPHDLQTNPTRDVRFGSSSRSLHPESGVLQHRTEYRIRIDAVGLCFASAFPKTAYHFSGRCSRAQRGIGTYAHIRISRPRAHIIAYKEIGLLGLRPPPGLKMTGGRYSGQAPVGSTIQEACHGAVCRS